MLEPLESLSYIEAVRFLFYVTVLGMFVRFGFRYADWVIDDFKDLFSHRKKDR